MELLQLAGLILLLVVYLLVEADLYLLLPEVPREVLEGNRHRHLEAKRRVVGTLQ